jgi:hypothetical protein
MELQEKCEECGEPIGWAEVSRKLTPVSWIQVLALSAGLTGPKARFQMPLSRDSVTERHRICFVPGQKMMVCHKSVCGRKTTSP